MNIYECDDDNSDDDDKKRLFSFYFFRNQYYSSVPHIVIGKEAEKNIYIFKFDLTSVDLLLLAVILSL